MASKEKRKKEKKKIISNQTGNLENDNIYANLETHSPRFKG